MHDETQVTFASHASTIRLEGRWHRPRVARPVPGIVVCHPYPPGGGSLLVKIVRAVARRAAETGVAALRFNFRGVGLSQGEFEDGAGEVDDVAGALDWLTAQPEVDPARLAVVGYSFGAVMALRQAARDRRVGALALIGLPLAWYDDIPPADDRPRLFVAGDRDDYCPLEKLRQLVDGYGAELPVEVRILAGTDHFFLGREDELAEIVLEYLERVWTGVV
jgi:alpha/beta superfamily hydrolase